MLHSIYILLALIIWERTCNYLLNKKTINMETIMISEPTLTKQLILWIEHISLVTTGFVAGAIVFYFRSKHYLKTRLFTKDEVRQIVHMALGEKK